MPKKAIQLSDHFTYSRLLRFVLPCTSKASSCITLEVSIIN